MRKPRQSCSVVIPSDGGCDFGLSWDEALELFAVLRSHDIHSTLEPLLSSLSGAVSDRLNAVSNTSTKTDKTAPRHNSGWVGEFLDPYHYFK